MLEEVAGILRDGRRFLVTMHRRPDGDALGSSLGLALALREMGKEVVHYNPDPAPYNFRFLPGVDQMVREVPPGAVFDATLVTDTASLAQLGPGVPEDPTRRGVLVNIDHHRTDEPFGDVPYVDVEAAAAGVLVWRVLQHLGHPISSEVAHALYAAILADTGSFRYDSTDPECLRITGELIASGVRPWEMASRIYESNPPERVRLLASALSTLEISNAGRYATITVSRAMLDECGATEDMLDGFVNHARAVEGVEVAALFVELPEGGVKVSMRSRGNVALSGVGARLGGKGKPNAASAHLTEGLPAAKDLAANAVAAEFQTSESAVA